MVAFPRLRLAGCVRTETVRKLVRETRVDVDDLVYPLFIEEGKGIKAGNTFNAGYISFFTRPAAV